LGFTEARNCQNQDLQDEQDFNTRFNIKGWKQNAIRKPLWERRIESKKIENNYKHTVKGEEAKK
jgi:hypothetical protein